MVKLSVDLFAHMESLIEELDAVAGVMRKIKRKYPDDYDTHVDAKQAMLLTKKLHFFCMTWSGGPNKLTETMASYLVMSELENDGMRVIHNENQNGCDLMVCPRPGRTGIYTRHEIKTTQNTGQCSVNFTLPSRELLHHYANGTLYKMDAFHKSMKKAGTLEKKLDIIWETELFEAQPRKSSRPLSKILSLVHEWGMTLCMAMPPLDATSRSKYNEETLLPIEKGLAQHGTGDGNVIIVFDDAHSDTMENTHMMRLYAPFVFSYISLHFLVKGKSKINLGGAICRHCDRPHRLESMRLASKRYKKKYQALSLHDREQRTMEDCIAVFSKEAWLPLLSRCSACEKK